MLESEIDKKLKHHAHIDYVKSKFRMLRSKLLFTFKSNIIHLHLRFIILYKILKTYNFSIFNKISNNLVRNIYKRPFTAQDI